jgi:hypothetical protein
MSGQLIAALLVGGAIWIRPSRATIAQPGMSCGLLDRNMARLMLLRAICGGCPGDVGCARQTGCCCAAASRGASAAKRAPVAAFKRMLENLIGVLR